ncbi:hypothetical protein Taro_019446 [Colocasia esculenta]|uniref:Uncharacterized protein n=1 Tax=Colocasia esculenta TaxID=4460 RepID=A0A843UTX7_COLES|nr:hypothetical protein [Colocasia esculenta]
MSFESLCWVPQFLGLPGSAPTGPVGPFDPLRLTSLRPVLWHLRACPSARCAFGLLPFPGTPILVGPLRVVSEPRVRPSSCRGAGQLVRSHCLALQSSGAVLGGQAWDRSPARLRLVVVFVHVSHSDGRGDLDSWSSGLCSREPVLVFVRSALCHLWSAALAIVVVQQDSSGSRRRVPVVAVLRVWCVITGWFVSLVLLMMESLVEVFLVRRTVVDKSVAVLLVVVGCAFYYMVEVHCWLALGSGEVFPELFLACSGGGFSQNFFVLVSSCCRAISGLRSGAFDRVFGYCVARMVLLRFPVLIVPLQLVMWLLGVVVLCFRALACGVGEPTGLLCFVVRACVLPDWSMWDSVFPLDQLWAFVASQFVALTTCCGSPFGWPRAILEPLVRPCALHLVVLGVELFRLWDTCGGLFLVVVPHRRAPKKGAWHIFGRGNPPPFSFPSPPPFHKPSPHLPLFSSCLAMLLPLLLLRRVIARRKAQSHRAATFLPPVLQLAAATA